MTQLSDFPVRRLLVPDDFVAPAVPVLNAPRPLLGDAVEVDRMGFTVAASDDERFLDQNLRLDAYRLEFVTRSEAAAEVRGRLAVEYPEVDLDTFDDDEMVGMWAP